MVKKVKKRKNKNREFCDPSVCDECIYIGEGEFICDKLQKIVVANWQPTNMYLKCKSKDGGT